MLSIHCLMRFIIISVSKAPHRTSTAHHSSHIHRTPFIARRSSHTTQHPPNVRHPTCASNAHRSSHDAHRVPLIAYSSISLTPAHASRRHTSPAQTKPRRGTPFSQHEIPEIRNSQHESPVAAPPRLPFDAANRRFSRSPDAVDHDASAMSASTLTQGHFGGAEYPNSALWGAKWTKIGQKTGC